MWVDRNGAKVGAGGSSVRVESGIHLGHLAGFIRPGPGAIKRTSGFCPLTFIIDVPECD